MATILYLLFSNAVVWSILIGFGLYKLVAYWEAKSKKEMESKWPRVGRKIKIPKEIDESLDEFEKKLGS